MAISLDIHDQVSAALRAMQSGLSPERLNPVIGRAEVVLFQKWFISRPPNKLGWPSTGFYADAARATNFRSFSSGVVISVNKQGIRQRYQGGEIKPLGGKKYLTIPARPEAYGKRAGDFNDLVPVFRRENGVVRAWALVQASYTEIKFGRKKRDGSRPVEKQDVGGAVMFWLVKSVTQRGDQTVIPSDEQILNTALETIDDQLAIAIQRGGRG